MVSRSSLILVFALCFAGLILVPPFLGQPFPAYRLIHWADVLDLLTPLVLVPLYWVLFSDSGAMARSLRLTALFLALAALWTLGQGMHLGANSINNLLGAGTTHLHGIVHFYDEVLSHYLWHAGIAGLSILLVFAASPVPVTTPRIRWGIVAVSAVLYGLTYFLAINEGGTVPIGLPAAALIPLAILAFRRSDLRTHNMVAFFFVGYLLAVVLFLGWYAYWGGFPEFSEVGLL